MSWGFVSESMMSYKYILIVWEVYIYFAIFWLQHLVVRVYILDQNKTYILNSLKYKKF